jgi:hypothetical protein
MAKNDGGPAFPGRDAGEFWFTGKTLRDDFAGRAMNALLSTRESQIAISKEPDARALAADCYRIADAMLLERAKP